MFSKVNGNVDLYPKQTIAKESPTRMRSAFACSAIDPDIESHAVSAMIFRDFFLKLTRSEGNIINLCIFLNQELLEYH